MKIGYNTKLESECKHLDHLGEIVYNKGQEEQSRKRLEFHRKHHTKAILTKEKYYGKYNDVCVGWYSCGCTYVHNIGTGTQTWFNKMEHKQRFMYARAMIDRVNQLNYMLGC